MRLIKRLLAILFGLVGVIVLASCVAGVIAIWLIQKPLLERTKRTVEDASRALNTAVDGVKTVEESLRKARKELESFKMASRQPGNEGKKPTVVDRLVAGELESKLQNVNATVNVVTDASVVLNSLLHGLNELPDTSISPLDTDRLKEIQGSLGKLTKTSQRLSNVLDTDEGRPAASEHASEMDEMLVRVIDWIAEVQVKMVAIQSDVSRLKDRTPGWIHNGTIVTTVVLSWLAFSQFCVIGFAWHWFRRQNRHPEVQPK